MITKSLIIKRILIYMIILMVNIIMMLFFIEEMNNKKDKNDKGDEAKINIIENVILEENYKQIYILTKLMGLFFFIFGLFLIYSL